MLSVHSIYVKCAKYVKYANMVSMVSTTDLMTPVKLPASLIVQVRAAVCRRHNPNPNPDPNPKPDQVRAAMCRRPAVQLDDRRRWRLPHWRRRSAIRGLLHRGLLPLGGV